MNWAMRGAALAAIGLLGGCGGSSLDELPGGGIGGGSSSGGVCDGVSVVCMDEANKFEYDASNDKIRINNLPFDLDGTYSPVPGLLVDGHQVYRNDAGIHTYFAIYVPGSSSKVGAGVAGTPDYVDYGYSGTVFRGRDTVNFPKTGEARYQGDYAGIRIFEGGSAENYGFSSGTVNLAVDFEDFDDTGAITGYVDNRRAYDENGTFVGNLPSLGMRDTGFKDGQITETEVYEIIGGAPSGSSGTLAGIFGGNDGKEIAGVLVLEGPDFLTGDNVRETGAFVLDRISLLLP